MNGHNNFDDSDDDDDDIDDSVEESDEDISEDEEEESDITMDEEHLKKREPGPASQLAQRGNAEGMDDDSDWDSEDISELDEVSQDKGRASQQQQQQHQQRQQQPQGRQGRPVTSGRPKVKECSIIYFWFLPTHQCVLALYTRHFPQSWEKKITGHDPCNSNCWF